MNRRRSGGEIVNATLLEVFLALTFIVFALAVFERTQARAEATEVSKREKVAKQMIDSLKPLADSLSISKDSLDRLAFVIDSMSGGQRPNCEGKSGGGRAQLLIIKLLGPDSMEVTANRAFLGRRRGESWRLNSRQFLSVFADVREYSDSKVCRFLVRVVDTEATSKAAYKRLLRVITTVFRPVGAFS